MVTHIAEKETTVEMWEALKNLYQHISIQRRMLLENQMRSYRMNNGQSIDTFLRGLNEIRDQLAAIRVTPDQELMVRTALNVGCLRRLGSVCPEYSEQRNTSTLGRDVGSSSPRRDQTAIEDR